jgi:hypothetical protein
MEESHVSRHIQTAEVNCLHLFINKSLHTYTQEYEEAEEILFR